MIMSAKFFNGLSPERQKLIHDAMLEAAVLERKVFLDRMGTIRAKLLADGVKINKIDVPAFVALVQPVWQKYAAQLKAEDLLAEIQALAK